MSRAARQQERAQRNKKLLQIILIIASLCLALAAVGFWIGYKKIVQKTPPKVKPRTQVVLSDPRVLCPLTGEKIKIDLIKRQPLAVMIDNAPEARPQSGLTKADIIFEMPVEGPVTRLMAIYLSNDSQEIGPVRSARHYFVKRIFEYDAVYVHSGGSEQAKIDLNRYEVPHLDELLMGSEAFWRTGERAAPNNLYSSTNELRRVVLQKSFAREAEPKPFKFLEGGQQNTGGVMVPYFNIKLLGGADIKFVYQPSAKSYLRFHGEEPHLEALTGQQLKAKNIIIQFVNTRVIDAEGRRNMEMIGEGKAFLFSQGKIYRGTWSKDSLKAKTYYRDESGQEFLLTPGQTWIEVVPLRTRIDYPLPVGQKAGNIE